jgi:Na+-transporting methylmalonyl-CoA/oxaloacetate decarboxylase gamma subunit
MTTNQDRRDRTEQIYYDRKGVKVTDRGCDARGDFYAFPRIISYELKSIPPDRKVPLGLIAAGVLLLVVGIGIIFLIIGIWLWFQQQSEYWIIFETKEISKDVVYQTKNSTEAKEILAALDVAIANLPK